MLLPVKSFSYKGAFVGFIIGASISLGMLRLDLFLGFGVVIALIFGFRKGLASPPGSQSIRRK